VDISALGANFKGKLSADAGSIEGTFSQGDAKLPLLLKRKSEAQVAARRPQDPVKPYPYREEEVSFENKSAAIRLAGTVTTPPDAAATPRSC
jgi:hypothetical protein